MWEIKSHILPKGKTSMIFLLIIWLVVLTSIVAVCGLAILGKFARVDRDVNALVSALFDDEGFSKIEKVHGVFEVFLEDFKNLQTSFENLQKTSQYDNSTLAGSMELLENRIGQIYETEEGLRQDINLLLSADKEHPVLAPSKGGRPRKDPV